MRADNSALSPQSSALHVGLLVPDLSQRHGWAGYSLSLIEALRKAGLRLTVIAARNCPPLEGQAVHRLLPNVTPAERFSLVKQFRLIPSVSAVLRDCDVIHATIEPYAPLGAWVAGIRPLVITGHGSYVRLHEERRWPASMIYRRAFQRATLVCVSQYTAKVAQQSLPGVRTVVVNNGVDVERFARIHLDSAVAAPVQSEDRPQKNLTILSVGAVKKRKGTLELVRAMAEVRQVIPNVQCIIIGRLDPEPAYVAQVRAAISALRLDDCVHLLGHVAESALLEWYGKADIFVVPSVNDGRRFEGYGLVYLEASAAGLPVIGTTENGAEDAIDNGVTGLLVPQNAIAEALPGAIIRLLSAADVRTQMGAAGRVKAARQTWDAAAVRMIAVYQNVVARHA